MSDQKPDNNLTKIAKLVGVCLVCFGLVYGIVSLVTALTS
jgi:hypothetical protein